MSPTPQAPITGHCSGCNARRRLRFSGWATNDGHENSVRPRGFYRQCETCGTSLLVLGDADDSLGLVRVVISEWRRATGVETHSGGDPASRTIDLDELRGELELALWTLYSGWDPAGLSFTSYATGILRRRVSKFVAAEVGSTSMFRRNGRGTLVRVWPKAHATSVCSSIDGAASGAEGEDDARGADRLGLAIGAVTRDHADDRDPDLGRFLSSRGR